MWSVAGEVSRGRFRVPWHLSGKPLVVTVTSTPEPTSVTLNSCGAQERLEGNSLKEQGGARCQTSYFPGPRFSWAVSRPDGAQKPGLPLDWSHTATQFDLKSYLTSLGFLVSLRPSIYLFQEAGGKRAGGSRGAGPMPSSCWAVVPAVGPPGSRGCLVTRWLMASWSCQGRLLTGTI